MSLDLDLPVPELLAALAPRVQARMEKFLPRAFDADSLAEICGPPRYRFDEQSLTAALADPVWYCLDSGGKRWRPALMLIAAEALGVDAEGLYDLAAMCELMHNGTLIIDDIEDDSPRRRGRKAVHAVFGLDVAVNAGNLLYFLPLSAALKTTSSVPEAGRLRIARIVAEEMARLHCGQAMDIAWHRGSRVPTVEQYLQMCAFKTGALARMSVLIAAAVADAPEPISSALGRYAESLGIAFQIRDDILNVTPSALSEGKGFGEDIHEGKITLIVIHALEHLPPGPREVLLAALRQHISDPRRVREATDLLAASGSVEFAGEKARLIVEEAWREARAVLPDNAATRKLGEFGQFVIRRDI